MSKKETKNPVKQSDVEVLRAGTQIIIPPGMTWDELIIWAQRKKEEDERIVSVLADIDCAPLDGLVAFQKALSSIYGWTALIPTPGFFGDNPPLQLTIPTGPGSKDNVQAAYGRMQIPGIDGYLETGMNASNNIPSFRIHGEVRRKHETIISGILEKTKEILKEDSIYKGKAIKVNFDYADPEDGHRYDPVKDAPRFMEPTDMQESDLIFSREVMDGLNVGLFTPIEASDACREHKIPLKRGVLLHGPYGTGKTLTATVTAKKAVDNGWTFIYLDSVRDLQKGLQFAAKYAPAVLFAEDIDRVMHGNRSMSMDAILNTLDGVDTKGAEIITVLTTNHIEQINPTLLRMGRLDTLVEVTPPDAEAAIKLVKLYARDLLDPKTNLKAIGEALQGKIPAFIREVTERAKIAAIRRLGSSEIKGHVLEADLLSAANAMEPHARLLQPKENFDTTLSMKDIKVVVPMKKTDKNGAAYNA